VVVVVGVAEAVGFSRGCGYHPELTVAATLLQVQDDNCVV